MSVDYGRLISRTAEIVWRNRVLWIIGFILAITSGGNSFNYNYRSGTTTSSSDLNAEFSNFMSQWAGLLIVLAILGLVVAVFFLYLRSAAEASLISTTEYIERTNQQPTFPEAWGLGWAKAGRLFALNILVFLIGILVALVIVFLFAGAILAAISAASAGSGSASDQLGGVFASIFGGICCLVIVGIPVAIVVSVVLQYAARAIVLEDQGVGAALGSGWTLFRSNLGPSLMGVLINFGVGIVQAVVSIPAGIIVAAPAIIAIATNPNDFGVGQVIAIVLSALLAGVVFAVFGALFTAYNSVLWTLLYRHLRGLPNNSLAPAGIYPPGGGGYYNPQYGAPTAPMPPYGQPGYQPPQPGQGGYQPPYQQPGQGGYQPPYQQPGQGGYQPPYSQPGQGYPQPPAPDQYNPPQQPPGESDQGRVNRDQ